MTSSISAVELINALKCLKANNLANQKEGFLCFVVLATANASAILRLLSLQNLATSVLSWLTRQRVVGENKAGVQNASLL